MKLKVDGTSEKFNAWLVAKYFTQKLEIDYLDTDTPTANIATI